MQFTLRLVFFPQLRSIDAGKLRSLLVFLLFPALLVVSGHKSAEPRFQRRLGVLGTMERNAELGIMQSIFRSASRREALGKHSKVGRRDGGLKMDWTKPLPSALPM